MSEPLPEETTRVVFAPRAEGVGAVPPVLGYVPPGPKKPRVWPSYVSFPIVMGVSFAMGAGVVILYLAVLAGTTGRRMTDVIESVNFESPGMMVGLGTLQFLILMGAAFLPAFWSPGGIVKRLEMVRPRMPWWMIGLASIGGVGFGWGSMAFFDALNFKSEAIEGIAVSVEASTGISAVLIFIVIAVFAPVGEELYFRGYVQSRLVQRHGPWVGILVASVFFGIMHFDWLHSTYAFGFGIFLGLLAWKAQSVWPAVVAHGVNNGMSVVSMWVLPEDSGWLGWVMLVGFVVMFAVALGVLLVFPRKAPAVAAG